MFESSPPNVGVFLSVVIVEFVVVFGALLFENNIEMSIVEMIHQ
jgi:hypothetical protein